MRTLQLSSPSGTPAPLSTGCTTILPTPKSVPPAGWIRVVLCQLVAFQRPLTLYSGPLWQTSAGGAKLFANLNDWYLWIKPQCLLQTVAVITGSVNLALQSTKTQVWRASCQDPIPPEFQDKVTLTLSCLGGHLQIHGDIEPSIVVLGEQATMEKTTQRFQRSATTLADLNAASLNAQAVNELLTTYVGAASLHVLRMSFVPEREAHNFDRQVTTFLVPPYPTRHHLSVVFPTPQTWWTWCGLCSSTPCCCSMARLAVDHSHINGNNPVTGHRFALQRSTTTKSSTSTTPNHSPNKLINPHSYSNHLEQPFA